MESDPATLLRQGIAAAKAGQREAARNLFLRLVEEDERNVTAWLWLSGAVESLDDRQVCLENVLALDPGNEAARRGLEWVRGQKRSDATSPGMPVQTQTPPSEFDDELLCPYCAARTALEDKTCPECKGALWRYLRRIPEGSYWFWMLLGYLILTALARIYWMSLSLFSSIGPLFASGAIQTLEQFVGVYLGLDTLPPPVAALVLKALPPLDFWSFVVSILLQLGLALLVYLRWQPIYWIGVALATLYLVYAIVQVFLHFGQGALLGLAIAAVPVLILLRISEDFIQDRHRIYCEPDKDVRTHSGFYMRGREYAQKKMWTLAAVHFRRAAAGAPGQVGYHLALAMAYARLNRHERAQSALHEAQRLAPDHPDVREFSSWLARRA